VIRVLIKAQSPVARAGLESLLRDYPSLQLVDEDVIDPAASDLMLEDFPPDVAVVQIQGEDDTTLVQQFPEEVASGIPVVSLVPGPLAEWSGLLRRGARAVLPSNATGKQIAAAIEAVAAGLVAFDADETSNLFEARIVQESADVLPEALTVREIEILRCIAEGLANKEIASRFGISEHTVKFHVASVMGKLGAQNRTEAVMAGIRHGIVLI
jgi:two-component system, NarL family, response regulator YdfI